MKATYHAIPFVHSCGRHGTVLEICARGDGRLLISGVCVVCGTDFETEFLLTSMMASCIIKDYLQHRAETPEDVLADFVPKGRPN